MLNRSKQTRLAATDTEVCVSFELKRFEEGQRWERMGIQSMTKYSTLS